MVILTVDKGAAVVVMDKEIHKQSTESPRKHQHI